MDLKFDFSAAFTEAELAANQSDFFKERVRILINQRERLTGWNNVMSLDINGDSIDIVQPRFESYGLKMLGGLESKSLGSDAIYPLKIPLDPIGLSGGLLLQILPPHCETSNHCHRDTDEIFCHVAGDCRIRTEPDLVVSLSEVQRLEVKAQIPHYLFTGSSFAVTLIRKIGPHFLDCSNDYRYVGGGQGTSHSLCEHCEITIPAC